MMEKSITQIMDYGLLSNNGKVSSEIAKQKAESEFEKYRIIQDKLYVSDFDRYLINLETIEKKK